MFLSMISLYLICFFLFSDNERIVYIEKNDEKEDPYQHWDLIC